MSAQRLNIADLAADHARRMPDGVAVAWPERLTGQLACGLPGDMDTPLKRGWRSWSFARLGERIALYAGALAGAGITPGMRTILMVRPGPDFFALTFALLRMGAVPVLIDPGMGKRNMAQCLSGIGAGAFVAIPLAHLWRLANRRAFAGVRVLVTVGERRMWGGRRLSSLCRERSLAAGADAATQTHTAPDDPAAILFTSGSTGPAKGVLYRHSTFDAQVRMMREQFGLRAGQVDVATFPLFALFDAALGITAVIPDMDPTRPGEVNPRAIADAVADHRATNMFASPALLDRISPDAADREHARMHACLGTLRRVLSAGAPVRPDILERFASVLPAEARIMTPYGATEALPVAVIDARDILSETRHATARGAGVCVGRAVDGVDIRIISITEAAIERWSPELCVPTGMIGEIVVRGAVVTREYAVDAAANAQSKIVDGAAVWHRMGDVGYLDNDGRLWFCGRKAHRVECESGTLFTITCEAIFNAHAAVRRTALVGVGKRPAQTPVLCVEVRQRFSRALQPGIAKELRALGAKHEHTRAITTILFHPLFPVDIRHNAKIGREELAIWAERQLRAR